LGIARVDFRAKVAALRLRLEKQGRNLGVVAERLLRLKRERSERLALQLQERSPLKVLERGYAIATDAAGAVLRDANQVVMGDEVRIRLHRGGLTTEVKSKEG
jgi:exodeoxyribonuclease VII large subunit